MRLKPCYIHTNDIKEFLNILDKQLTTFIESRGIVEESISICKHSKITQILEKWTFTDINFINLKINIILYL